MNTRNSRHVGSSPNTQQAGISLIEMIVVLAVVAILAGLALPSLQQFRQRQQLRTLADALMTDIQQARGESVQRGGGVQFSITEHAGGSCYIFHTGAQDACSCSDSGAPVCSGSGQVLKAHWIGKERHLSLSMNARRMNFDGRKGTVTPTASIEIVSGNGDAIRHVVAITGRVRSCASSGKLGNIPSCAARG